ncbi:hypothetical protein N7533_012779 [Penicillium manginii]|uniref:uncharacterized protein n=1 Tax=Penicillium manginii TaxID=203109 RepID=UPI002549B129|nr:uncharacterized protein N7533_012779 [Penicillium manginii]KAJ5739995.1 hypothetical protein N7533_012779 [Penicillium manginii]
MSRSPANDEVDTTAEERISAMLGYQSALKNPHVSDTAKQEATDLLNNELGWDAPRRENHAPGDHHPASVEASTRALNTQGIAHNEKRGAEH